MKFVTLIPLPSERKTLNDENNNEQSSSNCVDLLEKTREDRTNDFDSLEQ
jgi:hypothetical protein